MREKRLFSVFGFPTTFDALESERLLTEAGLRVRTIPRPVSLGGAECGVATRLECADAALARAILDEGGIEIALSGEIEDY